MKLSMKSINPKNLFRSKKRASSSSLSKSSSEPSSFNTSTSTSSFSTSSIDDKGHRPATPTSVLPPSRTPAAVAATDAIPNNKTLAHTPELLNGKINIPEMESLLNGKINIREMESLLNGKINIPEMESLLNGKINIREMESLLLRIAIPDEIAVAMLAEIDRDGDGCVSVDEFGGISESDEETELRETFDVFDSDRDGRITAEELLSVFEAIGDEECTLEMCRRMIQSVDVNGDGFVCFQDFCRMMKSVRWRCVGG